MNINWVLATDLDLDPTINISRLKDVGSIWGSWRTWRSCQTDNVICNDLVKARELVQRQFQNSCNFYVPRSMFVELERPTGVNVYEGQFNFELTNPDDVVAMHLAASKADVILLLGFDLGERTKLPDPYQEHLVNNYRTAVKHTILDNPNVQWVLIDHNKKLDKPFSKLENLTQDTIETAFSLAS